jgi:hypothetical protein
MFTQSCCDVKVGSLAVLRKRGDLRSSNQIDATRRRRRRLETTPMLDNILRWRPHRLAAVNENAPQRAIRFGNGVSPSKVRALATGAALATSLDNSPAVLLSIYDYAHRYRDKGRRTA